MKNQAGGGEFSMKKGEVHVKIEAMRQPGEERLRRYQAYADKLAKRKEER